MKRQKEGQAALKTSLPVFTKGELQDQENKLWRSGLQRYFDVVSIVSDKKPKLTAASVGSWMSSPSELVMVGNSFKSDIAPALSIGCSAIHIPVQSIWAHEKTEEYEHPNSAASIFQGNS